MDVAGDGSEQIRCKATDAGELSCESTSAVRRKVLEMLIGADLMVDEANEDGVAISTLQNEGVAEGVVEADPAGRHEGDSESLVSQLIGE